MSGALYVDKCRLLSQVKNLSWIKSVGLAEKINTRRTITEKSDRRCAKLIVLNVTSVLRRDIIPNCARNAPIVASGDIGTKVSGVALTTNL